MMRLFVMIVSLFAFQLSLFAQKNYPKGYFRWPLDLKPEIVANLGELRPNHWHMGLDIRTNQVVNQRVYAAAEGYIAFIGIKPSGFGRYIVINHPNGLSTLYAHLNEFAPAIEKYVTDEQYRQQSWSVELTVPKEKFPVTKGTFISFSGTTGGSQGPHLHFEIRDTKSGKCLNPMMFGLPLTDNVRPSIVKLALYDRSRTSYVGSPKFFGLQSTSEGYIIAKNATVKTGSRRVSFAIQAFDRISGSQNEDGIYSAALSVDGKAVVDFMLDSIDYDATSYMNAHIDFRLKYNGGAFVQHVSQLPNENSGVYHQQSGDGVIALNDTAAHDIRIEVRDAYQNISVLNFKVQYDEALASTQPAFTGQVFIPGNVNVLDKSDFEIYIPEICLYDTIYSYYNKTANTSSIAVSPAHQVNDPSVPVHDNLRVRIKPDRTILPEWRDKIVIQRSYRDSRSVQKAETADPLVSGNWLSAQFGDFGTFQAFADVTPPTINNLGSGDTINLSGAKRIVFTPTDNFGIKTFRAELDGQWLRFTNDKGRTWIYEIDERCPYGVHSLTVTATDLVGNATTKTWWFKRSAYTPPVKKAGTKKATAKKSASTKKKTTRKKK